MKVVCKTNITSSHTTCREGAGVIDIGDGCIVLNLTVGKVYEVHRRYTTWVYVIDDSGAKEHYHKYMFTPLVELRNEKIEELLK
jgi:hypothetical protein